MFMFLRVFEPLGGKPPKVLGGKLLKRQCRWRKVKNLRVKRARKGRGRRAGKPRRVRKGGMTGGRSGWKRLVAAKHRDTITQFKSY